MSVYGPEDSRCPPTYRREEAVKTLIALGWSWDGERWNPPSTEDGGKPYGYCFGNSFWEAKNPRLPDAAKRLGTPLFLQPARPISGHAGYLVDGKDFYYPDFRRSEWQKHQSVQPLYIDEWEELADDDAGRKAFGIGWNACRKGILGIAPVAWMTDAPLVCGEKVTRQKEVADGWNDRGWHVLPLYAARTGDQQ